MRIYYFIFLILFSSFYNSSAQKDQIKFASLAPEGSTWLNVMKEYDAAIRQETGGKLGFKIYAGGIMGDEKNVLRKIRLGQLHSAGFTGVGLGEILPEVRIFDSPFLFQNYAEVDFITTKFYDRFAKAFEEKGYVLLGWAEVGFVYVFSNIPITKKADMDKVKIWMWEGDPVARATFEALGISARSLSVIEVMTALQTGMVDAVYTSPLAIIGLQWFTKVKYMMKFPLADAAGAVLISKDKFDKLSPENQQILLKNGRKYLDKLKELSRQDNEKSIETLKKNGIQIISPPDSKELGELMNSGQKARQLMADKLFSRALLDEVETTLQEFRKNQTKK
ncbi:TRAP transporter substrate-binding protein DctP [candidate division KSB1 bacterium]|nr:TRAP transporter substrate-binding protein DctP [candidate division KSB1 bacterium]